MENQSGTLISLSFGRPHEANVQGGGNTVHVVFKYLSPEARCGKGWVGGGPPNPLTTSLSPI
jgi:hypothetical protein